MAPVFNSKDEAYEHALKTVQELKAAGYDVELIVEGEGTMPDLPLTPPDAASHGEPAGGGGDAEGEEPKGEADGAAAQEDKPSQPAAPPPSGGEVPVTPLGPALLEEARKAGALGRPILLGGRDVEDGSATLVVYRDPGGGPDRPVVFLKLLPDAEAKLMAALADAAGKMMKKVTETTVYGRASWDAKYEIAEQLIRYAKSVNYHVGDGTPVPPHTLAGMEELGKVLDQLAADPNLPPGEKEILAGYRKDYEEIAAAIKAGTKTPRKDYGERKGHVTVRKEEWVPAEGGLAYAERPGSRLVPQEKGGVAYWNGYDRSQLVAYGKEIAIDFGDGWKAVYHPHGEDYKVAWSYKGTLELHLPPGADPAGISEHLERLYLQGQPMTRDEAEAVYLSKNAWAMGLAGDPDVRQVEEKYGKQRVAELEGELLFQVPVDGDLQKAALRARLEAERRAAREKAVALRAVLEKKLNLPPGSLPKLPTYNPLPDWEPVHCPAEGVVADPKTPGGYVVWRRFDVDPVKVRGLFRSKKRVIGHILQGNKKENLKRIILGTGVLAAQETRWRMGAHPEGNTMSPMDDMHTGGAAYAFLRVGPPGRFDIEWDAETLLVRADWFWRPNDKFGATNPQDSRYTPRETRPEAVADAHPNSHNEIVFKHGISLFHYPPRRIRVPASWREEVLGWFKQIGVTHLGDRPVEEVVVSHGG